MLKGKLILSTKSAVCEYDITGKDSVAGQFFNIYPKNDVALFYCFNDTTVDYQPEKVNELYLNYPEWAVKHLMCNVSSQNLCRSTLNTEWWKHFLGFLKDSTYSSNRKSVKKLPAIPHNADFNTVNSYLKENMSKVEVTEQEVNFHKELAYAYMPQDGRGFTYFELFEGCITNILIATQEFIFTAYTVDDSSSERFSIPKNYKALPIKRFSLDGVVSKVQKQVEVTARPVLYDSIEEVIKAHPNKATEWMLNDKYQLVIVSDDNLNEICNFFKNYDKPIAYDTETTGLKITFLSRNGIGDKLVGVVLSPDENTGYYFPVAHSQFPNLCNGDDVYFMEHYMRDILEDKPLITHNGAFDFKVAQIYGLVPNIIYDTMVVIGCTYLAKDRSIPLSLKGAAALFLGRDSFELSDFVKNGSFGNDVTFADFPYEFVRRYAPLDTMNTYALYNYFNENKVIEANEAQNLIAIELQFSKATAYSEFYGIHLNMQEVEAMSKDVEKNLTESKALMFEYAGKEFNPNSPAQIKTILYSDLGAPTNLGTSTDAESLGRLSKDDGTKYQPFVKALLTYRKYEQLNKTFIKNIPTMVVGDGYVFGRAFQFGAVTGRVTYSDPNLQSFDDNIKKRVTGRPHYYMFDSDFAQVEQRVLVSMACARYPDEPPISLLKDFDDPDVDYHQYQASRLFSVPYAAVTKEMRKRSKGLNFGLPYGMGDASLGNAIYGSRTEENTQKAGVLRKKFFEGQELIERFFKDVRDNAVSSGYTDTLFKRRRYYNLAIQSESKVRREAGNAVIQGTAADLFKCAVNNLFTQILKRGWLGKVLINAFIHDEVVIELHESINPYEFFNVWRKAFEVRPKGFCRLFAGAGVGKSWYAAKSQDLPPLFLDEICAKGEDTSYVWDENVPKFFEDLDNAFKEHKIKRVYDYVVDPNNQEQIIKPAIQTLLNEVVEDILDSLQDTDFTTKTELQEYLKTLPEGFSIKTLSFEEILTIFFIFKGINNKGYLIYDLNKGKELGLIKDESKVLFEVGSTDNIGTIDMTIDPKVMRAFMLDNHGFYLDFETMTAYLINYKFMLQGVETTIVNYLYGLGAIIPKNNHSGFSLVCMVKEGDTYNEIPVDDYKYLDIVPLTSVYSLVKS